MWAHKWVIQLLTQHNKLINSRKKKQQCLWSHQTFVLSKWGHKLKKVTNHSEFITYARRFNQNSNSLIPLIIKRMVTRNDVSHNACWSLPASWLPVQSMLILFDLRLWPCCWVAEYVTWMKRRRRYHAYRHGNDSFVEGFSNYGSGAGSWR